MSSSMCLTQRHHQVYTLSGRFHKPSVYKNTFLFLQHLLKSYLSNIAFTFFTCVLLSNNDNKHQHCIYLLLVSCSPTMTAITNTAFTFLLVSCSPTMTANINIAFTAFTCVLLSNNDNKHQHCIYLLLVSCSPTMTANTNTAFTFLHVSCSPTMTANTNIAFTFTIFELLFPSELFLPLVRSLSPSNSHNIAFTTPHSHQYIRNIALVIIAFIA